MKPITFACTETLPLAPEEIAGQMGYAARSIKRKLQMIRGIWEKELER